VFRDNRDREQFLELLKRSCARYHVSPLAFVLLPNHFHLVAQTHEANLSRWMHWLMVSYTVYFNWRHRRSGHLFQGRYKSFLVGAGEGEHLLSLSRYVHLNPVRGKVLGQGTPAERREELRRYRWSSYRSYAGLERSSGFVEEELVLEQMGGRRKREQRLRYRRFVEEGLLREIEKPWEAVRWQTVLGNESFVRKVRDHMAGFQEGRGEVTALRQGGRRKDPMKVLRRVSQGYGVPIKRLQQKDSYGLEARNVAMWLVWEKCGMSLREMGVLFGGLDYSAVAQRLRRLPSAARKRASGLSE
jgi:putative transposase